MQKVTEIIAKLKEEAVVIIATTVATLVPTFVLGRIVYCKFTNEINFFRDLKEKMVSLENKIDNLTEKLNSPEKANQDLNEEVNRPSEEAKLHKLSDENLKLSDLMKIINSIDTTSKNCINEINLLKDGNIRFMNNFDNLNKEITTYKDSIGYLQQEVQDIKEKIETKYTEQNKKIESLASDKETLTDGLSKLNNSIKSMGDKIDQNTKFVGDLKQEVQGFGKIVNENKAAIQGLNTEGDIELAKPNINNDNTESSDDNMNFESIKPGTGADGVGVNEERIEVDLSISGEKESSSDDDEDLGGEN